MSFVRGSAAGPGARRVIVTDGGDGQGRSALAAVQALGRAGFEPLTTTSTGRSLAGGSRWCRGRIRVPTIGSDPAGYAETLSRVMLDRSVLAALPASDAALVALNVPGRALIDKGRLAERAREAGLLGVPGGLVASATDLESVADSIGFPVVVKPTVSTIPAVRISRRSQLSRYFEERFNRGPYVVQPYLTEPMHAVAGVSWQDELPLALHQRYLRTWPRDCGTSSAAITTPPDEGLEAALARLLQGYRGIFQAQFAGPYLLDLNLRVYGSMPLAEAAGLNLPAALCRLLRGETVATQRARPGVSYRWLEGDLRTLFAGWRGGCTGWAEVARALRPRRGTAHSVYRLSDPVPMLLRLADVAAVRAGSPRERR